MDPVHAPVLFQPSKMQLQTKTWSYSTVTLLYSSLQWPGSTWSVTVDPFQMLCQLLVKKLHDACDSRFEIFVNGLEEVDGIINLLRVCSILSIVFQASLGGFDSTVSYCMGHGIHTKYRRATLRCAGKFDSLFKTITMAL